MLRPRLRAARLLQHATAMWYAAPMLARESQLSGLSDLGVAKVHLWMCLLELFQHVEFALFVGCRLACLLRGQASVFEGSRLGYTRTFC